MNTEEKRVRKLNKRSKTPYSLPFRLQFITSVHIPTIEISVLSVFAHDEQREGERDVTGRNKRADNDRKLGNQFPEEKKEKKPEMIKKQP